MTRHIGDKHKTYFAASQGQMPIFQVIRQQHWARARGDWPQPPSGHTNEALHIDGRRDGLHIRKSLTSPQTLIFISHKQPSQSTLTPTVTLFARVGNLHGAFNIYQPWYLPLCPIIAAWGRQVDPKRCVASETNTWPNEIQIATQKNMFCCIN